MDTSRLSNYSPRPSIGISPQKSKQFDISLKRCQNNERSDKAAYWAIFNSIIASILYYDLCYIQLLNELSSLLIYLEWLICAIFTLSAFYDIVIHFWLMNSNDHHDHINSINSNQPNQSDSMMMNSNSNISNNNNSLNVNHSTNRFDVSFSGFQQQATQQCQSNNSFCHQDHPPLPPFEILHLYDEDERIVTAQQADLSSADNSMNRSRRSQVTDKESLAEYLREVQEKEQYAATNSP